MSYGAEFNPNRLGLARRRRGLTKRKLAELIGADVRAGLIFGILQQDKYYKHLEYAVILPVAL